MLVDAVLFGLLYLVGLGLFLRFRRGPSTGRLSRFVDRAVFDFHRNRDLPALIRNSPVVAPVLLLMLLPVILLFVALFGSGTGPNWPHWARSLVVWLTAAYVCLTLGVFLVLSYRPPSRLTPRWLRESDRAANWSPPRPDRFDRIWLLLGVVSLLLVPVYVVVAVIGATSNTPGL
jgi:hypothetical protein